MKGLYLARPHGDLIYEGKKTLIVKGSSRLDLSLSAIGPRLLVSGGMKNGKVYGEIELGKPEIISTADFASRFDDHRVTEKEREQWWPDSEELYLYPITSFKPYDDPKPVVVPNAVGTLMEEIQFKEEATSSQDSGGEQKMHLKVYSKLSEANPAIRGIKPPVTLAQANLIAKWADAMEEAEDGPESPWAAAIAQFKRLYRVEDGKWVKKKTKEVAVTVDGIAVTVALPVEEDEKAKEMMVTSPVPDSKARGEGQGVDGEQQEDGGVETCVCPECDTEVEHKRGIPCVETKCPECGAKMEPKTKEDSDEDDAEELDGTRAKWTRAYVNNLPDSAFLYIEPGGEKDKTGRTVPRSKRHLPYKDDGGKVALPQLRNARSRLGQPKTGTAGGEQWLTETLRKRLFAKAQRLLERASKKSLTVDAIVAGTVNAIKNIINEVKEPDPLGDLFHPDTCTAGLKLYERDDGDYLVTWTTNAFEDREKEIFSTQSIEEYVARHSNDKVKGVVLYRHWPATAYADIVGQKVVGRFLVEVSKFHDTPIGYAWKELYWNYPYGHPVVSPEGWACSHGFVYGPEDLSTDGVYHRFDKKETTVLPARMAANPYTAMEVYNMKEMDTDELTALLGEEAAKHVENVGVALTKRLEKIANYKATEEPGTEPKPEPQEEEPKSQEPAQTEETPPDTDTVKALSQAVADALQLKELSDAFAEVVKRLDALEKSDEQRRADKEEELPRYSWFVPSQQENAPGEKAQVPTDAVKAAAQGIASFIATGGNR